MAFTMLSLPSRSYQADISPSVSEDMDISSGEHSKENSKENNDNSAPNTLSSSPLLKVPSSKLRRPSVVGAFAGLWDGDTNKKDKDSSGREESSFTDLAPLTRMSGNQMPAHLDEKQPSGRSRGSIRRYRPFKSSSAPKTSSSTRSTAGKGFRSDDVFKSTSKPAAGAVLDDLALPPPATPLKHPRFSFEQMLRPGSSLSIRGKEKQQPPTVIDRPAAIPVAVSPVIGRPLAQYRSTSSSYPTEGMRTPHPGASGLLCSSPPVPFRSRIFSGIGQYGKNNTRLSLLHTASSGTSDEKRRTETETDESACTSGDGGLIGQEEKRELPIITIEKHVEAENDEIEETPQTFDTADNTTNVIPSINTSTETIIRSSSELLDVDRKTEEPSMPHSAWEPDLLLPSVSQPVTIPPPKVPDSPKPKPYRRGDIIALLRRSTSSGRETDIAIPLIILSPATPTPPAADSRPGSDIRPKPSLGFRITRRVHKFKFGKWLAKRVRRVKKQKREKKTLRKKRSPTEAEVKRLAKKMVANRGPVYIQQAGGHSNAAENNGGTKRGVDTRKMPMVGVETEKDRNPAVRKKTDTIRRKALRWVKEQQSSVELVRFLMGEMKSDMKSGG